MKHDIKAPEVGESISEVSLLKWNYNTGDQVKNGDVLLEIESDKATVEVIAESDGALEIVKNEGETVPIGEVIARIDDQAKGKAVSQKTTPSNPVPKPTAATTTQKPSQQSVAAADKSGPAARKAIVERGVDPSQIKGTGKDGRITKGDVINYDVPAPEKFTDQAGDRRVKMPRLRQKIAETLVHAQRTAAILTTFNEVDMSAIMKIRKQYKDSFQKKHDVKLSFMSFFTRAVVEALKKQPDVNASIDGTDIIYHDYQNIGIAVGTEKGLVVPVLKNAEKMDFPEIEKEIARLAAKARDGKLSITDMSGGTFTISNGGTYGSLLSTPILNPPQSGILGMHNIVERPVAVNGKVEIRPMMYLAHSYDHRMIDGKGAVTFLVDIIQMLQNPETLDLGSLK